MAKRKIPKNVREICYKRDEESCQWEGCELSRKNGDVINLHHILPEQFGGKETPNNLITYCDIHHKNMHAEFHAFYPDSQGILLKMNRLTKQILSKIRLRLGVDDGYDLTPYLIFLTGSKKFNPGQLKAIRAALSGKDVLFVSPTGSGKSACYQLPGLLGEYPTLVISPLKSLMKNQVESIWSKKIPTTYINSDISKEEKKKRYEFIQKQLYKFLFVAPERFESKDYQTEYLYQDYSHLVIDEAHEIVMWGMAFRPSYRKLGQLHKRLNKPPIIALTATASKDTQDGILESLALTDAEVIVSGFYRDNIEINVHKVGETDENGNLLIGKLEYIKKVIQENPNQKIIIFTPTVKLGEELISSLLKNNIFAELYHSKLESKPKMQIQNRFCGIQKPELNILISTSAFGMGIDIPNIRHAIHLAPALSVTDYTQQIGRAGRDKIQSYAHLLYSKTDDGLLKFMAELPTNSENFKLKHDYSNSDVEIVRNILSKQVEDMIELINQPKGGEWTYILDYFGEKPPTFWSKHGKSVVDLAIISIILFILIVIVYYFL